MIEILEFLFQSFWHWAGTLLLLGVISSIFRGFVLIQHITKEKEKKIDKTVD
ncbi:MAG: hypothetical protein AB7V16_07370 [Vulcanibacillus sp.]